MRMLTSASSALYYLTSDHLGSTSLTTDASGNVISRQMYLPYGQVRSTTGTLPTDIGFTGQRLDATGLMFYNARYYDAALGRFISADTLVPGTGNPQGFNHYTYTFNNPLRYIDSSGHICLDPITSIVCAIAVIGSLLFFSQIPGDTELHGQPGNPYVAASGLAMMSEPIDWLLTAGDCLVNSCDPVLAQMALAQGPSPSLLSKIDDVPSGYTDEVMEAAAHFDDVAPSPPKDMTLLDDSYIADGDLEIENLMMSGADLRVCGGSIKCHGSVLGGVEHSTISASENISIGGDVIGNQGGLSLKAPNTVRIGGDVARRYKFEWTRWFVNDELVAEHIFDSQSWYQDLVE